MKQYVCVWLSHTYDNASSRVVDEDYFAHDMGYTKEDIDKIRALKVDQVAHFDEYSHIVIRIQDKVPPKHI